VKSICIQKMSMCEQYMYVRSAEKCLSWGEKAVAVSV
jgi:hypothetical protein